MQVLESVLATMSVALFVGRFIIHRRTDSVALQWAGYLNAAAEVVGLATLGATLHYLPLLYSFYESTSFPSDYAFTTESYYTIMRIQMALFIFFWLILLLVKLSTLMLYRALFAISIAFKAA